MSHRPAFSFTAVLVALLFLTGACAPAIPDNVADLGEDDRNLLGEMLAEEDRRPAAADAETIHSGMASPEPLLRHYAVRGLGRLEDPEALTYLAPALDDQDARVRATAAAAIAQSVFNGDAGDAADLLHARLGIETDAAARGAIAQALGRLRPDSPGRVDATRDALIELSRDAPVETLLPTLRGLEWLARANRADITMDDGARERLVALSRFGRRGAEGYVEPADGDDPDPELAQTASRIRRLALATLNAASATDADTIETALYDPDVEVRRLAATAVGLVDDPIGRTLLIQIALDDSSGAVRYEGLGGYSRALRSSMGCEPLLRALDDDDPHVALRAIDLLSAGCRGADAAAGNAGVAGASGADAATEERQVNEALQAIAATLPESPDDAWQAPVHALIALASTDPGAAIALVPMFAGHAAWQVRVYAARASSELSALETLSELLSDADANVAETALRGWLEHRGDAAHTAAITALQRDDYPLLMTAAATLEGSDDEAALPALFDALARITAQQRETSRDPRRAILERVAELGDAGHANTLRPYLQDFDPAIAQQASEIIFGWTNTAAPAAPRPLPPQPFPSIDQLLELDAAVATITMRGGGSFDVELHPLDAPTNVARFVRQARDGYLEGLTFHRVVPNFVIQGGSPGANEYVGDGPFSRDELGDRSHQRGTVGISTRGRDTGDSQIFVNLVDNVRLDHNFTIIGTVVDGIDVVDAVLEGGTIERVTIEPRRDPE